jgi:PrsW family intramembrane metalloprotease
MISSLISIILIILFSLFPLLLWNYGTLYLRDHAWNRGRFFAGIIGGIVSIGSILIFEKWLHTSGYSQIWAVVWVFIVLGAITYAIILYGSRYIRGFLRKILILHIALFVLLLMVWEWMSQHVSLDMRYFSFLSGISGFFIAACLEEWAKHVSSIWLSARDFRFSRRDFLLFTFFVTLGFALAENLAYFIGAYTSGTRSVFFTWVYRLLFALPLHVLSASICVMLWWKALSYGVFSWRYVVLFVSGFILAILVHSLYNLLIEKEQILLLIIFAGLGYMSFTQWILALEEKSPLEK